MPMTPEQWLEKCSPTNKGGRFKLFLGYAPGVGKTHTMLTEAIRRHSRGEDVVIGCLLYTSLVFLVQLRVARTWSAPCQGRKVVRMDSRAGSSYVVL